MKQVLIAFLLIIVTAVITSSYYNQSTAPKGTYSELISASTPKQMEAAFKELLKIEKYSGTIPEDVSRKAFKLLMEYRDMASESKAGDEKAYMRFESWVEYVSHLAAISGDVELFRKMTFSYFGSATSELTGAWVEKFLQYNPYVFFSIPDTWAIWSHAGGSAWCCDEPEVTIPIVKKFVGNTKDAKRIFEDIKETAIKSEKDTEWAKEVRKLLSK